MNKLTEFLREKRLTDAGFAALIGVNQTTVTRWRRRRVTPSPSAMRKIARETNGAITPNDFIEVDHDQRA